MEFRHSPETHDQYLTPHSRSSCYDILMSQDDRYAHTSTSSLHIRSRSTVVSHSSPMSPESRNVSTSVMRPKGARPPSIVVSTEAWSINTPVPALRIRPKRATVLSHPGPSHIGRDHDAVNSVVSMVRPDKSSARPTTLQGGRHPSVYTTDSQRRRPRGARAPSMPHIDFNWTSPPASVQEDNVVSPPGPTTADPGRPVLIPSQLRAKIRASTGSSVEEPVCPLPSTTLRRSSHVRRKVSSQPRPTRMSTSSLPRIITEFPQRLSQVSIQDTPPLSGSRAASMTLSTRSSSAFSSPSPKEALTPRDSPVQWQDSPSSSYSAKSLRRTTSIHVEWDSTGYLTPAVVNQNMWDAPSDATLGNEAQIKRQNTEIVKELLRQRRRRAGMD